MADIASTLQNIGSQAQIGAKKVGNAAIQEGKDFIRSAGQNAAEEQIGQTSLGQQALETAARVNRARRNAQRAGGAGRTAYAAGSLAASGVGSAVSFLGFTISGISAGSMAMIVAGVIVVLAVVQMLSSIASDVSNPFNAGRYIAECSIVEGKEDVLGCVGEKSTRRAVEENLKRYDALEN